MAKGVLGRETEARCPAGRGETSVQHHNLAYHDAPEMRFRIICCCCGSRLLSSPSSCSSAVCYICSLVLCCLLTCAMLLRTLVMHR